MEPLKKKEDKYNAAGLIPYKRTNRGVEMYLQKRTADAKRNPGCWGMFGGGVEKGETPEAAMQREIAEELEYKPLKPIYFSDYETADGILHVFFEEVPDDFDNKVIVHEGDFGRFITIEEFRQGKVSPGASAIIPQLHEYLSTK